jgi:hypothetical protein
MKIRIAAVVLAVLAAAACSQDLTGPAGGHVRRVEGVTTVKPDSTPATDDGGTMMGSGSRTSP